MVRISLFTIAPFLLVFGFATHFRSGTPATGSYLLTTTRLADPVEGSYRWKAVTIKPGIDFGKGPVTDLLAITKADNRCIEKMVITFRSGGTVVTNQPASCEGRTGFGIDETSHWVRTGDTMVITDAEGKSTSFALSFSGGVMRLSGKTPLDGSSDKTERQLLIELARQ